MNWIDGSVYKGDWDSGIQHGLGLMKFADGTKKAGFFEENIFKAHLEHINEVKGHEQPVP